MTDLVDKTMTETIRFTLKDCSAREIFLEVGEGMHTLGDVRRLLLTEWSIPKESQRLACSGRIYTADDYDDTYPLTRVLSGTSQGHMQERILWVCWISDEDTLASKPRRRPQRPTISLSEFRDRFD